MSIPIDSITKYLEPLLPYIEKLLLFIIPIYKLIGEFFAILTMWFLNLLPNNSYIVSYIAMGVIIALGIVFGYLSDKNKDED